MGRPSGTSGGGSSSSNSKKRKASPSKKVVKELVPIGSPWTQRDWWNESSGTCRPVIAAIQQCLESSCQVLVNKNGHSGLLTSPTSVMHDATGNGGDNSAGVNTKSKTKKHPKSPKRPKKLQPKQSEESLLGDSQADSFENFVLFDRGHARCSQERDGSKKVWTIFHPSWGKLLSTPATASPWMVTMANTLVDDVPAQNSKFLKHAILKPAGLISDEFTSCVARFTYKGSGSDDDDNNAEPVFPLRAAAQHVKIAQLKYLLLKARNIAESRRGNHIRNLKIELSNSQTADLTPILQVVVDDEHGEIYVSDVTEVLDAMIGYCSTLVVRNKSAEDEGWIIEQETCGDLKQLFEGWEPSNEATAKSFVELCLASSSEEVPGADNNSDKEENEGQPYDKGKDSITTTNTSVRSHVAEPHLRTLPPSMRSKSKSTSLAANRGRAAKRQHIT